MVVDTLGQLLTLTVTPAGEQERAQAGELLTDVQAVTHGEVEVAYVDQGYTRDDPAMAAAEQGITLEVVKLPEAKRGFVLLPRRWVADAASHGRPAFADSPGTTNACPRPSPGSTTSLAPACCSAARPIPSQVHNSY
jgi:transposase